MKSKVCFLLLSILSLSSCGAGGTNIDKAAIKNIPTSINLNVGEDTFLFPEINDGFISKGNFKFVSDLDIVSITDNKISALAEGSGNITVYSDDNYNNTLDDGEISLTIPFNFNKPNKIIETTHLYVDSMAIDAYVGSTYQMNSFVLPNNATYRLIRYISEDNSIAKVSNSGEIKCLDVGRVTITAYNDINNNSILDENEKYINSYFSISKSEIEYTITLPTEEVTLKVGETYNLNPKITPIVPNNLYYGYESNNKEVAKVANGTVKAIAPGKAEIEVRYQGAFAHKEINVIENSDISGLHTHKLKINANGLKLNQGDTYKLTSNVVPANSIDRITYSVNNSDVIALNNDTITALKGGDAIITAKSGNVTDTLLVSVKGNNSEEKDYYNNYYGNLSWSNSEDLINKLHNIIRKGYTPLKYASPTNWESNQYADVDLSDNSKLDAIYSNEPIDKSATTSGWQREHAFAASLMTGVTTGVAVSATGRATDFHNLYAASSSGNTSRGNKNFGYADISYPGYINLDSYSYDKENFEPTDNDKGKVARAIFYMAVMYNAPETSNVSESWTFITEEDKAHHNNKSTTLKYDVNYKAIDIVENYVNYNRVSINNFLAKNSPANEMIYDHYASKLKEIGTTYSENKDEFRRDAYALYVSEYSSNSIGNLSTLLKWNSFNVDRQEYNHNNSVYTHVGIEVNKGLKQGNRNPFVDYPELVDYCFGSRKNEPGNIKNLTASISYLDLDSDEQIDPPTPVEDDKDGSSIDKCLYAYVDQYPNSPKGADIFAGLKSSKSIDVNLNGINWNVTTENQITNVTNNQSKGTQIGTSTSACGTLSFTTKDEFIFDSKDNITDIIIAISTASNANYKIEAYVNDVNLGEITTLDNTLKEYHFDKINNSGVVKIVISNINAAIYLKGIGIHAN